MENITAKVFHNMRPRFNSTLKTSDVFREVGHIDISQKSYRSDEIHLDELYADTQNISFGWISHHKITTNLTECRSTSVGDVIQIGEAFYVVADYGFDKLLDFTNTIKTN